MMTMSMSAPVNPASASAFLAEAAPNSAMTESSSSPRSAMRGVMRPGSRIPSSVWTWRRLTPEA